MEVAKQQENPQESSQDKAQDSAQNSEPVKDMAWYEAHPEELPKDVEGLDRLIATLEENAARANSSSNDSIDPGKTDDSAENSGNADSSPAPEKNAEPAEDEPPFILSKSGKGAIPYAVLEGERREKSALKLAIQKAEQEKAELLEKLSRAAGAGFPGKDAGREEGNKEGEELPNYQELLEDFPSLSTFFKRSQALEQELADMKRQVATGEARESARMEQESRRQQAEVRAEVDENPHLLYWESHDPDRWRAAVEADRSISLVHPDLPTKERFCMVVDVVNRIMGDTELPPEYAARLTNAPAKTNTKPTASVPELPSAPTPPKEQRPPTIGEIQGGSLPESDELQAIANMSNKKLEELATKHPEQFRKLLEQM